MITNIMESFTENSEGGIDYSDLQTQLEYMMIHKLNLNKATYMDLTQLVFLGSTKINAIIRHRIKYGPLLNIYELQAVEDLDEQSIALLVNFVTVTETEMSDHEKLFDMIKKGKHELILLQEQELQQRKGYRVTDETANRYLGNAYRQVARYRFAYNKRLVFGYSAEKDMGELYGKTPLNFFDFNSFHLLYRGKGVIKNIAIGDFQANMGKGLTFGSGMATRKSAMVLNGGSFYETFRPYRSVNESGFLRGAAVVLEHKHAQLSMFASVTKISATLNYDSLLDAGTISAISLTGLHRTPTEIAKRNNSRQYIAGLNLAYIQNSYKAGLIYVVSKFDADKGANTKPYALFEKPEKLLQNTGVYGQALIKNVMVYGELSASSNKALAGFVEALIPLHTTADFLILYRNYSPSYLTVFANAFSEYGNCRNEQGIYMALALKPLNFLQINMYADIFNSPWLRYLVNAPSAGQEYLVNIQYNLSKTLQFEGRYKYEQKPRNVTEGNSKTDYPLNRQRQLIRLQLLYQINKNLTFKTRFEQVFFDKPFAATQSGTLFFEDVHVKTLRSKLSITMRMAWFDIYSFDARVYATENDVLYNYAIPQYQNQGWRMYILLNYKLTKKLDVYFKYAQTTYSNTNTIGSSLETINGNTLQEVKVQLRVLL
ncbi:MAG: helix-hairpin-helix domain-containing protein [Bacteroidia bacterium]|nr:helix-hairpin-helix domain-containing protein [Bacteroidia bacterium]